MAHEARKRLRYAGRTAPCAYGASPYPRVARTMQLPALMPPHIRHDTAKPWLLILEFPTHADAKAAAELIFEQLGDHGKLRAKQQRPSAANIGQWQFTKIARAAFPNGRTFGREEISDLMLRHNYLGREVNAATWLSTAKRHGVIDWLRKNEYHFPPQPAVTAGTPCETSAAQ